MSDHWAGREYEERLRRIVLLSADAVPDRVAEYLEGLASERSWRDVEQPLKEHASLVRNIPRPFVEYTLKVLIEDEEDLDWSDNEPDKLGIRRVLNFFPAAPVQGPFLSLLRHDEDEGIRLVHGLTNRATEVWKTSMQTEGMLGTPLTPAPLALQLPSGEKTFWGDEHVYRWHRGTSVGPPAVVSSLMALEMWLEEQLESGRDAEELFAKVLAGSDSVAVLGVCASVSVFAPDRCLAAVLPLLSHPRLWRMDVARRANEAPGRPPISLPITEALDRILAERNRRPCRAADVRSFIPLYLFAAGEELRERFEGATAGFRARQVFEFEEERASPATRAKLEDQVELYAHMLDRTHYQEVNEDGASFWRYVPPDHLREGARTALASEAQLGAWCSLAEWARSTIDSNSAASGMTAGEAIELARSFVIDGDLDRPVGPDLGLQCLRLEAVAQAAAAALVTAAATLEPEPQAWCRGVLIRAALSPRGGWVIEETPHPSDVKVSAARGLGALVASAGADDEVRATILSLVIDPEYQVVEAVFSGLAGAWQADPVLCWNSLSLALTVSAVPRRGVVFGEGLTPNELGRRWLEDAFATHLRNLEEGIEPELPRFPGSDLTFFVHQLVASAIKHLPTESLLKAEPSRPRIVGLIDNLMDKTFAEIARTRDDRSQLLTLEFRWIGFLMEWLANAGLALGAADEAIHVLDRIEPTWPELPSLTDGLLRGFLKFRIGTLDLPAPSSMSGWERICTWVLGSPEVVALGEHVSYGSDFDGSLALIVFVEFGKYWFNAKWEHAPLFDALFDRWVATVGTNHAAYSALVTMLGGTGARFGPVRVLGWLKGTAERSGDLASLWAAHRNGERTAELLGALDPGLTGDARSNAAHADTIWLVDRLAACGIAHASQLRDRLERPRS